MAVHMNNWVDISSTSIPEGVGDRDLGLRLITRSEKLDTNTLFEATSVSEVIDKFGADSDEVAIATNYLGFTSLTATMPQKISFWRPGGTFGEEEEARDISLTESLNRMAEVSDDFGSFFFVGRETGTWSEQDIVDACKWVSEQKKKFRFCVSVKITDLAVQTGLSTWEKAEGADDFVKKFTFPGVTAVLDDAFVNENVSTYPEWLSCALLAATKYDRANSTIIQDFKGLNLGSMNVTCDSQSLYKVLCGLNVNFYGATQKAGKVQAFYMEGYNLDGDDTSVCDNDIWLKDRITTEVFNRFVKCNKIPAGVIGRGMIKGAIGDAIVVAKNNGTILPEKTISNADKAAIIQNTGATDAPAKIYADGYYIAVFDLNDTQTMGKGVRRVVGYILYYSTGEGIRKVEGSHILV